MITKKRICTVLLSATLIFPICCQANENVLPEVIESSVPTNTTHASGTYRSFERLEEYLNLTEEQIAEIRGIVSSEKETIQELVQQVRAFRQELRVMHEAGDYNPEFVLDSAQQQSELINDLIVIRQELKAKIGSVLTPEQRVKATALRTVVRSIIESRVMQHFPGLQQDQV
ncbi:Spy/CpxP family protein refolding chaperone [Desulfosediminicola ganghwensis]|uniref:Spy/CpxP family protein refolding chaperone n=1 Tax=Desulfosediminicola ganghwensis TaxID=2569540 RepID=UPI0010AD0289|nr:Spy/CpxP family protein refolding chaperone [Desulfosediminicola ganghwensis]